MHDCEGGVKGSSTVAVVCFLLPAEAADEIKYGRVYSVEAGSLLGVPELVAWLVLLCFVRTSSYY